MAPVVSSEEEFRMLYCALKITGVKPAMPDLAVIMGLKNSTAYVVYSYTLVDGMLTGEPSQWRWNKLMKRLEKEFGDPTAITANASTAPAAASTTSVSAATAITGAAGKGKGNAAGAKRKRTANVTMDEESEDDEPAQKKAEKKTAVKEEDKGEGDDENDGDVDETTGD